MFKDNTWSIITEGIIETNPLAGIRTPKPPERLPKIITEEQMRAVFRVVVEKPREKALLLVLLDTGIALSEVAALDDADVANADLAEAFQDTSPVMNIGLPGTRQKGHRFRNRASRGEQYDPGPGNGIQPVSYAKDKKSKKKKPRNHR